MCEFPCHLVFFKIGRGSNREHHLIALAQPDRKAKATIRSPSESGGPIMPCGSGVLLGPFGLLFALLVSDQRPPATPRDLCGFHHVAYVRLKS
jgi:hypothetical protein